jgi:hypothetical protein
MIRAFESQWDARLIELSILSCTGVMNSGASQYSRDISSLPAATAMATPSLVRWTSDRSTAPKRLRSALIEPLGTAVRQSAITLGGAYDNSSNIQGRPYLTKGAPVPNPYHRNLRSRESLELSRIGIIS